MTRPSQRSIIVRRWQYTGLGWRAIRMTMVALILVMSVFICTSCGRIRRWNEKMMKEYEVMKPTFEREAKVRELAEKRSDKLATNKPGLCAALQLTQVSIFGRDFMDSVNPSVIVEKESSATDAYIGRIPFWCEGINGRGKAVRRRCQLSFTVKFTADGMIADVGQNMWTDLGPLTFRDQFQGWAGATLFALFVVFSWFWWQGARLAGKFAWLALLPASGYFAWVCFGSGLAVFVCLGTLSPFYAWVAGRMLGAAWTEQAVGIIGTVFAWLFLLAVAGWLLWNVVPYVARGTVGWFEWLFGHFS